MVVLFDGRPSHGNTFFIMLFCSEKFFCLMLSTSQSVTAVCMVSMSIISVTFNRKNQSRTNGPINAHLTIAQVSTTTMKNKKYCCKSFVEISAVAQQ